LYREFFQNEKFVAVLPEGQMPSTSSVLGSNYTQLQVAVDQHTNRLIVSCVLDNLGKGAASQAIQNANLMYSLPEEAGISSLGLGT
jgi:N-acetyl-gamma-glutamyl-phosphate reductase